MTTKQNAFILARAATLLVEAYGKCIPEYLKLMGQPLDLQVGPDAPNTYEDLKAQAAQGLLKVSTEFNNTSIYGASGNLTFRIFHDLGHLMYDAQFTTAQEVTLATIQWVDLKRYLPAEWVNVCKAVYMADTVEQSLYEEETGHFLRIRKPS